MNETNVLPIGTFYGTGAQRRGAHAVFSLVAHERPRTIPGHAHEAAYFCLLEAGSYRESDGERELVYRPLTLAYHPAGMCHCDEIGPGGARFFMIELESSWAPVLAALGNSHCHLTELDDSDALWLVLRLRRTVFDDDFEGALDMTIPALLHELAGHAAPNRPAEAREPAWLAPVESSIREGFASASIRTLRRASERAPGASRPASIVASGAEPSAHTSPTSACEPPVASSA